MKYIKIYEYPHDNIDNENDNILYWNSNDKNNLCILNLIDKNSKKVKNEIIEILDNFHTDHFTSLSSININLDEKVNYWSCNSMFDNNIYAQTLLNTLVKFHYLKSIIKEKNINKILLNSKNSDLVQNFKKFTYINKIDLEIKNHNQKFILKKNLKKIFHPLLLAVPIFLIFLLKRIKIFIFPMKVKKIKKKNNILFIDYFMRPGIHNNHYKSVYWGDLDNKMELNNIERTWLHFYLPESRLNFKIVKNFFVNINNTSNSCHLFLDKFFDIKSFFKIIYIWIKIILNKRKIDKILDKKSENNFIYSLLKNDFNENIFGYKFFYNTYYFFSFKNFFRKNNFKKCFYLFENQSWERSLQYNLNIKNQIEEMFAVVHSSIRFWDFRYFNMKNLREHSTLKKFYKNKNDKIVVSSKKFINILKDNKYNDDKILLAETLRYSEHGEIKNLDINDDNKSNAIVIVGDYNSKINNKIESFILLLSKKNNIQIICKPHPLNEFSEKIFFNKKIIKSNEDIKVLSQKYDHFLVANTSTVSLELLHTGKNVMTLLDDEFLNYSPLYHYYDYDNYVHDINQIYEKTKNYKIKSKIDKLFLFNKDLKNWLKYIDYNES